MKSADTQNLEEICGEIQKLWDIESNYPFSKCVLWGWCSPAVHTGTGRRGPRWVKRQNFFLNYHNCVTKFHIKIIQHIAFDPSRETGALCKCQNTFNDYDAQWHVHIFWSLCSVGTQYPLQWGAADAEIKVPSGENTELVRSPFKAWSRSVYATLNARDFFLAYFYPSGPFTCIFSKTSPDFSCVGCD